MTEAHWPEVRAIYQAGDTGHATFASSAPATWVAWQEDHLNDLSVVALDGSTVVGSMALHRALGFQLVGLRRRIGKMSYGLFSGQWRDVLLLERRSNRIGIS